MNRVNGHSLLLMSASFFVGLFAVQAEAALKKDVPQDYCATGVGLPMRGASLMQQVSSSGLRAVVARSAGQEPDGQALLGHDDETQARDMFHKNLELPSTSAYNFSAFKYAEYTDVRGSQHTQSSWVDTTLGHREGLLVVESGAWDGEEHSNSIGLETLRKWNCLLVEPNPSAQQLILSKHRHCHLLKGAFSATPSLFSYSNMLMAGGLGGFNDTIVDRARASQAVASSQTIDGDRTSFSGETISVPCFRFDFVMSELGVTTVDYWSLDTEGSEPNILRNTDFNKIEVGLLTAEHNGDATNRAAIKDVMTSNGFVRVNALGPDDCYANPKYFSARSIPFPPPCGPRCD